jgi:hypothetical protein
VGSRDDSTTNLMLRTGDVPAALNRLGKLKLASVVVVVEAARNDGDHVGLDGVENRADESLQGPKDRQGSRTESSARSAKGGNPASWPRTSANLATSASSWAERKAT